MDNFMDKLVEKINAQGQIRPQNFVDNSEADNKNDAMIKELTNKFAQNNEKVVELASQYKESIEDSIHKENVRCYRNTQAMVEENMGKLPSAINEGLNGRLDQLSADINTNLKDTLSESQNTLFVSINKKINGLKAMVGVAIFLGVANLAALIVILLWIFRLI